MSTCPLGERRCVDGAPILRLPSCADEPRSPLTSANRRMTELLTELDLTRFRGQSSPWGDEESAMPKTRPPYPPQFRARLIELARTGRTPEELGRQFEPSAQTIRNWLRQADRDDGRRTDRLTCPGQELDPLVPAEPFRLHR